MTSPQHDPAPAAGSAARAPVTVELAVPAAGFPQAETRGAVAEAVLAHQRALRVPGPVEVRLEAAPGPWRLRVDGRSVRCADDDVASVVRDVTDGRTGDLAALAPGEVPEAAAGLCTEALQTRLSALLPTRHVPALLARAGARGEPAEVAAALRTVLDTGVPLDDEALAGALEVTGGPPHPIELAERLVDTGRSATLDVLFAPATLRRVTAGAPTDVFPALREELYNERGVFGPDFHLAADPDTAEGSFVFRANGVRTRARRLSPGGGLPDVAAELGRLVHRRAGWFVSMHLVRELGDRLAIFLPDTVSAVRARYSPEWLTALARAAAEEGMSLRNLAMLLDRLLDIDPHPAEDLYRLREGSTPPSRDGVAGLPRPRDAVVLLRQRMLEEVARMLPPSTVEVHRLDRTLEERLDALARNGVPPEEDVEEVLAQVRRMRRARPGDELPLVAPSLALRSWLWSCVRGELPELRVRALVEYPPGVDVVTAAAPAGGSG